MLHSRLVSGTVSMGIAAMFLLTSTVPLAAASAPGSSPILQDAAAQAQRAVVWRLLPAADPTWLFINSASTDAPSADAFQITYANGSFALEYERSAGGPVTSRFTVTVAGLVEWLPGEDDQFSNGSTIAYTPLGSTAFGAVPIQHSETTTSDGTTVHSFVIESNSHEVSLNLTISQGFVTEHSRSTLTPMEAELTFRVNHIMNENATHLALHLSLNTDQLVSFDSHSWDDEHQFSQNESAVNVTNVPGTSPSYAYFAWSNEASVNGRTSQVAATGPQPNVTAGAYDLYLSYPRVVSFPNPDQVEVVHDPTLGVVSAAYASLLAGIPGRGIQADLPLYIVSMAGVAAIVAGTALVTNRRRREKS
jgi:hypothetical protein